MSTDTLSPPVPNDALADELAVLRSTRAAVLGYLLAEHRGGASHVPIARLAELLRGEA